MKIIGIAGQAGSGKDTLAKMLAAQMPAAKVVHFGDALKRVAMDLYGFSYEQCFGTQAQKETVDERWGITPRFVFQRLGTEVGRAIHGDTWVKKLEADIQMYIGGKELVYEDPNWRWVDRIGPRPRLFIVADVRFPNEARFSRENGYLVRVERGTRHTVADSTHTSETLVGELFVDMTIRNDGTLGDLSSEAASLTRMLPTAWGE